MSKIAAMTKRYLLTFFFSILILLANSTPLPIFETTPYELSSPYPNPAKSYTSIEYQLPIATQQAEIKVYNLIGKEVVKHKITDLSGKLRINTDNFKPGIYLIYLVVANKSVTSRKLIVS